MGSALAGIGLAMGALSSGAGVIGSIQQANAQNAAIDAQNAASLYNASVAEQNAEIEEGAAKDELEQGRKDVATHQLKVNQLLSNQMNQAAANGISLNSDTMTDISNDTILFSGVDDDAILASAGNKATAHKVNALNYKNQSNGLQMSAVNNSNKVSGLSSIVGGVASGAADTINSYYKYKQAGLI